MLLKRSLLFEGGEVKHTPSNMTPAVNRHSMEFCSNKYEKIFYLLVGLYQHLRRETQLVLMTQAIRHGQQIVRRYLELSNGSYLAVLCDTTNARSPCESHTKFNKFTMAQTQAIPL